MSDKSHFYASRLRSVRADMLGTTDEDHFHDCHDAANHIEELERENADLRAQLEAARKDAERYRWLRGQNKYRSENVRVQVSQGPNWVYPSNFYLDSAIDAAIAQGKGEK